VNILHMFAAADRPSGEAVRLSDLRLSDLLGNAEEETKGDVHA
jgi:hypothetical protein